MPNECKDSLSYYFVVEELKHNRPSLVRTVSLSHNLSSLLVHAHYLPYPLPLSQPACSLPKFTIKVASFLHS